MTTASGHRYRWPRLAAAATTLAVATTVLMAGDSRPSADVDPTAITDKITTETVTSLVERYLPDGYTELSAGRAAELIAADATLAVERGNAQPRLDATETAESGMAELLALSARSGDWRDTAQVYRRLPANVTGHLAVIFPGAVGNLLGASFNDRVDANRIRLGAAIELSRQWPQPERPWQDRQRPPRAELVALAESQRQLIYFDPLANAGQGSWVELRGDLSTAGHVGVLVPGGSAFIISDNFARYSERAADFVAAADGDLAMIVWAGAPFPSGWVEEAAPGWAQRAAPMLADFLADLRWQLDAETTITLAGHSYGGAVVGLAETYDIDVNQVMHVASAGAGFGVRSPADYTRPCRPRFAMMAPGDPISYVQDVPGITGLGHGVSPEDLAGVTRLVTGFLPADPGALDDVGRTLGSQGIAGKQIGGVHAHSEVFIPHSDAWHNMLAVFTMGHPRSLDEQPAPLERCR